MTKEQKALIAVSCCVLFWGFSFISIKVAIAVYPPMTLGFLRFALAAFFFVLALSIQRIRRRVSVRPTPSSTIEEKKEKIESRDLPWLIGGGLAGDTLYFFFENNGVALISASEASLIVGAIPALAMIAEWVERKARALRGASDPTDRKAAFMIALWRWIGVLLSIAGVWCVIGASLAISGNVCGYVFMAGAAVAWVAYCFLTRPLFKRHSQFFIVFWQTIFGFIGFIPFAMLEIPQWGTPNAVEIGHIVFLGLCCSALGYWLYNYALETLDVVVSSVFINLIPVVTVAAGYCILGDRLSPLQWAGAVLVVAGVSLAVRNKG
ncbi:MAG: DMT family transporter [Treponema sp.]|jgi:drug/metabolite transporter (DMT)-like permease|nr:DMT family transporter [Treponema sp.]